MTTRVTFPAVYENGVFRPLTSFDAPITEGQRVELMVEAVEPDEDWLEMLAHFYDGLTEEEIDEIEKIILDRSNFFRNREQP